MNFDTLNFREMLASIDAHTGLDQHNIINKIKEMVQAEHPSMYKEWNDNKFDINHLFNQELTLLHIAARHGFEKVTKVLVAAGADINKKEGKCEKIPLHLAAENGHAEVVEFFLNKGVSVNVIDKEKGTPLHYAADDGSRKTISILINKNADPWLKNRHGKTPVEIYTSKNGSGYLAQLKKAKNKSDVVFYSTFLLGATMAASIAAINVIAPDVPALKEFSYAVALYAHASIAKSFTYKAAELNAKDKVKKEVAELDAKYEVKKEQDLNIINVKKVSDEKKLINKATCSKGSDDHVRAIKNQGYSSIELADTTQQKKVTLDDIIVSEKVRKDLKIICGHMSERKKKALQMLGCKIPTGYILYGPPGNGKTLIARAIACEANRPFFPISGADIVSPFIGQGAKNVQELFRKAREKSPSIIFIDEIDAIGRKRTGLSGSSEKNSTEILNQLLTEMDGFNSSKDVIVIAATNRLEMLDEALIRPGRFSKHIKIPLPDKSLRKEILSLYVKEVPMASDVNLAKLADETNGFSGADLENLVNEAKFCALDRICEEKSEDEELGITVTMSDFNNALESLKSQKPENERVSSKIGSICDIANFASLSKAT